jgi:hypothetical protein
MRKIAWIIFTLSTLLLVVLLVALFVDFRSKNTPKEEVTPVSYAQTNNEPTEEIVEEETVEKVIPVENIVLTKDTSECVESEEIRCFKSSSTGTVFSYPHEYGYLNVKTRMQYLDYGPNSGLEGNPFECFYEDIQSQDKKLTIYVQGGEITNGNCGRGFGADVVRELEFYDENNNHLYSGIVTLYRNDSGLAEKFTVTASSIKPASYVFGGIRIISYSMDTLVTILSTLDMDLHRLRSDYFMAEHTIELFPGGNAQSVDQYYKDNGLILEE